MGGKMKNKTLLIWRENVKQKDKHYVKGQKTLQSVKAAQAPLLI